MSKRNTKRSANTKNQVTNRSKSKYSSAESKYYTSRTKDKKNKYDIPMNNRNRL